MKTYKCPYCDFRAEKDNLIDHVDNEHEDVIPDGYTPSRVVFNLINKKEHGVCVVCKKETEWNEDACKYDRLCKNPKCREELRKMYEKNMIKVYNKTTLLDDPDQQEKMLAKRSISGQYTFANGEKRTFTGSYEKKALEFFDTVLNIKPKDIITPGPVFEYEYDGKKLKWITDILLIPFNLIIEVKDGGDNPNTRQMPSYREKQVAKEKMITSLGTYNYLRLTNNNFSQLLETLAELKHQMIDDTLENKKVIININETSGSAAVAGALANHSDGYVTSYGYKNVFSGDIEGFALSNDITSDSILVVDSEGNIKKESSDFLNDRKISIFKFKGDHSRYASLISEIFHDTPVNCGKRFFYEALSGHDMLTDDEIFYDDQFQEVNMEKIISRTGTTASTLIQEFHKLNGDENLYLPLMSLKDINEMKDLLRGHNNLIVLEDTNGYFVYNNSNCSRSISYPKVKDIVIEGVLCNGTCP